MRRIVSLLLALPLTAMVWGQTLNVVTPSVKYQIPADEAGNMYYSSGTLTILGKVFDIADITDMYVDESDVVDNSVAVVYADGAAHLVVAGNCMRYLTIAVRDANVVIEQADDLNDELTYTLSGTAADGSFYMNGSLKATVVLDNLSLTSQTTAPINIRNGKRIALCLVGASTLTDSAASDGKGALMVNGHSEIEGAGTLTINGYARHGYWADEYILLKKSFTGQIDIAHTAEDGINVNEYYEQRGGTLTIAVTAAGGKGINATGNIVVSNTATIDISATSDAYYDTTERDIKGVACLQTDSDVTIDGGSITLSATGRGGKGLKAAGTFTMTDGALTITTTGTQYTYSRDSSSPKGLRAGTAAATMRADGTGGIVIDGGTLSVAATGASTGSEAIESKNTLYINGGTVTAVACDDAINSARDMHITDGVVEVQSSTNDGLDSNANLYLEGGTVVAYGGDSPECSIDAAEGYNLYINGGVVCGVGGDTVTPASSSTQAYVSTTGTVAANSTISLTRNDTVLCSFTVPADYTSSGVGGGSMGGIGGGNMGGIGGGNMGGIGGGDMGSTGGYQILISCPELTKGTSYTLSNGTTSSTVTAR